MLNVLGKIAGLCGILVVYTCVRISISLISWFNLSENWLSDLGGFIYQKPIWAAHGIASIIFNLGIIIGGVLGIIFVATIRNIRILNLPFNRLGIFFFFLNVCTLFAIGVFPQTLGDIHIVLSFFFFGLIPFSLFFIGNAIRKSSEKTLGLSTMLLGAISLFSFPILFAPRPWGSNAIAEIAHSVLLSIFVILFSIKLLQGKFNLEKLE